MWLITLQVDGDEAGEGDDIRFQNLIKYLVGVDGAAKPGISVEQLTGKRLVIGMKSLENGLGMKLLSVSKVSTFLD